MVHPGDRIVVRGAGFDPGANTDGLPVRTIRNQWVPLAADGTRFHLGEIALADPGIEFTPAGTWLTAETSTSDTIGADSRRRIRLARLDTDVTLVRTECTQVSATFEPTLTPLSLQLYAGRPAAPITFHY